jgi:hypothetical protein
MRQLGKERKAGEKNKKVVVGKEIRQERTKERKKDVQTVRDMEKGGGS